MLDGELGAVYREIRNLGLKVEAGVKREWIQSRTVRERIEVIRCCREFGSDFLTIARLIGEGAVERMIALNRHRSEDLVHLAALNERQSQELITQTEPELVAVREALEGLSDVQLVRPAGGNRLELFTGVHSRRRFKDTKPLSPSG